MRQPSFALAWQLPFHAENGFTLVETMIGIALFVSIAVATLIGLTHRSGSYETGREQVAAFLAMAKSRAAINGDASGSTGTTVVASYASSSGTTTLTLFDGRPFRGRTIEAAPNVQPLTVQGRLSLDGGASSSSPDAADTFGVFIGASGTSSALEGYAPNETTIVTEPACDYAAGVGLPFSIGGTARTITLSCATGEILPDRASPDP